MQNQKTPGDGYQDPGEEEAGEERSRRRVEVMGGQEGRQKGDLDESWG